MRGSAVEGYLKLSLEKLGLEYVDMYLIHKPFGFVKDKYKHEPALNADGTVQLDLETNHVDIWKVCHASTLKEKQIRYLMNINHIIEFNVPLICFAGYGEASKGRSHAIHWC